MDGDYPVKDNRFALLLPVLSYIENWIDNNMWKVEAIVLIHF